MEEQCTHENIMTQEETIKACKPPREPKPAAVCDGTLAKPSLRKLNNKLKQISDALAGMEDAIKPAKDSAVIAPAMVDRLTTLTNELVEHRDRLTSYMEANKEEDTDKIVADAKAKMELAQKQFSILARMLKMGQKTFPDKKDVESSDCVA